MNSRIIFRPRARGCATSDVAATSAGAAVSALEPRWKFTEGVISSPAVDQVLVGAGSYYPVKVTLEQLFEIAYRVKDSQITGSVSLDIDIGGVTDTISYLFTASDPTLQNNWYDDFSGDWTYRAYSVDQVDATEEVQMWEGNLDTPTSLPVYPPVGQLPVTPTGLSHNADTYNTDGPILGAYSVYSTGSGGDAGAYFSLQFSGEVGVYDPRDSGSRDPFDPENELWIGLEIDAYDYTISPFGFTSHDFGGDQYIADIQIQLSGSTLNVPIYTSAPEVTGGVSTMVVGATEWWPYAYPNGNPYWNSATGDAL